jgi:predicted DNA-binding protein with PD1-like motif
MQVQLVNEGEPAKQYAVVFYQGDEAFSRLLDFAEKYHVASAHFTAIGALSGATLGCLIPRAGCIRLFPSMASAK